MIDYEKTLSDGYVTLDLVTTDEGHEVEVHVDGQHTDMGDEINVYINRAELEAWLKTLPKAEAKS